MADESFTGRESIDELAACFHGINLKLNENGIVTAGAMQLIHRGRKGRIAHNELDA